MSRTGSPSHSRRDTAPNNNFNNHTSNHTHGFRARPNNNAGIPSSSGPAVGISQAQRLNSTRLPSPASQPHSSYQQQQQSTMVNNQSPSRTIGCLLGRTLKLKISDLTANGGERWVEGKLWCYDPIPGIVILESPGIKNQNTYRMIKVNQLREVQVGEQIEQSESTNPPSIVTKILEPVRPINVTAVAMREAQAVKADEIKRARIGHGVSRWAQEIFDALGKTLPVRWHQTSIVILDDVLLNGPQYRPEDVRVSGNNSGRLARVQQVLEGEWARLLKTEEGQKMELEVRNSLKK